MASALNRVTLIGNLGADPEIRTTPGGAMVTTIGLATTESYKDKNDEWQESTEWHKVVLWNWLAERADKYLKKGSKIYVEGKLKTRKYEDKDNITRYITEVVASNLIMLTPKDKSNAVEYGDSENKGAVSDTKAEYLADDNMDNKDDDVPF